MVAEVTIADHSTALEIHALAQTAYRIEAQRIACTDFPPLRETVDSLRQASDRFLVFRRSASLAGVLSFAAVADQVTITRLVVSPLHFREGIGTTLIHELEQRLPAISRFEVCTALDNDAAVHFYRRLGFERADVTTSPEGIALIHFSKTRPLRE